LSLSRRAQPGCRDPDTPISKALPGMDPKTSLRNAYVTASLLGQLLVFE